MQHTRHARTVFAITALGWGGWWLLALWPLSGHWDTNPQYAYGWLVPPLALLLAWRRWKTRIAPEDRAPWAAPLAICAAAVFFPAWVVVQPNPNWRPILWLLALCASAGTLALAAQAGGRRWAWHFAFPALFIATAVPWPGFVEEPIVQGLMRFVASVTVAALNAFGIPAVQRGSLIEVAAGILGVDEACSGVRSLQATLMASLFLGELHRLRPGARLALVLLGFLAALLTNIGRTCFLSFSAARDGIAAVGKWHDPAGYTVLGICLVLVAILAEWMRAKFSTPPAAPAAAAPARPLPRRAAIALVAWLGVVVLATEAWYFHPPAKAVPAWTITAPNGAEEHTLPAPTVEMLACDRSRSASWRSAERAQWTLYFFEWEPRRTAAPLHRPEVCLPNVGLVEASPRRTLSISAAGFDLAFESFHFRDAAGTDAFVFFCPWEIAAGSGGRSAIAAENPRAESLRRVWRRERDLSRQVAEIVVTGIASRDDAEAALRRDLPALIQPTVPK